MIAKTAQRHQSRNFWLGVVSGVGYNLHQAVVSTSLVLTWFVAELTGSNVLISLLRSIQEGGWYFPQLLLSSYLQRQPHTLPVYRLVIFQSAFRTGLGTATFKSLASGRGGKAILSTMPAYRW